MSSTDELVAEAFAAVKQGDGAAARTLLESIPETEVTGAVLEARAKAAYLELEYQNTVDLYERAYAAYREYDDSMGAMRCARMLAYLNGTVTGNVAAMNGWLARCKTLLAGAENTVERGYVALSIGQFNWDPHVRRRQFAEALDIAREYGDRELEFVSLAYLGATLVHDDDVEEGMLLLDEACAAVAGHDVEEFLHLGEIFCQLFSACEHAQDVARADQWIGIGEEIAQRRNIPAVAAYCRTHYGGLLTAAGRWSEADSLLTEAMRLWGISHGQLRWGAAIRLADLRVRQGRLEEAEQLLEGMDVYTEAARPIAAVHLMRGEPDIAADIIERALGDMDASSAAAGALWSLMVDVQLARGDVEAAAVATQHLDDVASRHAGLFLPAAAALARGQLCLATGSGDPRACLQDALSRFAKARLPLELGRARFELARALTAERPEVAVSEAKAALEGFERLQAARHADQAAALLRALGAPVRVGTKGSAGLTKREAEVLELLGHGLSNPEISDRLFISRKTVEHHVGNILSKLGLRSRAEAAAYAVRDGATATPHKKTSG